MPVVAVAYEHQIEYAHDPDGNRFPRLGFQVARPEEPAVTVDVNAYLDSGAQRSLISGRIGVALGIDVMSGPQFVCESTTGSRLVTTLHPVRLTHPDLGSFDLKVAFSTSDIHRNLLGRDFFNLVQVGFREHHLTFYVTPTP